MATLKQALHIWSSGRAVMPLGKNKKPLLASWGEYQNRLPSKEEITTWWTEWPEANLGIITGKISNLIVVDVDLRHGGSLDPFPQKTTVVKTGNGGYHLYYKYSEGVRNEAGIHFKGVDLRGDGGYVVGPYSKTDYVNQKGVREGGEYIVESKENLLPFPVHLFGGDKKESKVLEVLGGSDQGSRNQSAATIAGAYIRAFPSTPSTAWEMLKDWNQKNIPPLSEYELRTVFNSILGREKRKPKQIGVEQIEVEPEKIEFLNYTEVLKSGEKEIDSTDPKDVISFGYEWLDNKMTGLFKGELVILGGETGTGKSTFAMNIITRASEKFKCCCFVLEGSLHDYGIKALWFEMGKLRALKGLKNYPWNDYRRNDIKDSEYKKYRTQALESLKNEKIHFAKIGKQMDIETFERNVADKIKEGFRLFLVDHLHYFDLLKGHESKADYIEKVMVRIKTLLIRTGATMILVVHYKKLEGRKPTVDSFKDSISIPQNADYVINIWRDRNENGAHLVTKLMVPKSRNPNGEFTLELNFDPAVNDYKIVNQMYGTKQEEF